MQRWWSIDDKANYASESSSINDPLPPIPPEHNNVEHRLWTFQVHVTHNLQTNEYMALSGSCASLGNWHVDKAVILDYDEGSGMWTGSVSIPFLSSISYRYFVSSIDPVTKAIHVRRWETHLKPRTVQIDNDKMISCDTFGDINGQMKLDRGWLTNETLIQFKFFNNPFKLKSKLKNRLLYVKLTPMNLRIDSETSIVGSMIEESLSNDTRENGIEQQAYANTEVVTLKYPSNTIDIQSQFGQPYYKDDILMFNVYVAEPDNVAYLIDLYTYSSRADENDPPQHIGYHYVLPNLLRRSEGILDIPITCATKHRPLGVMNFGYVKITPLKTNRFTLKKSFIRYWNKKWTGLDVGHRGSGTSFKITDGSVIRENTIASLKKAAAHGADMVEFDVQLSKDLVPVIYHDFLVYVSLKRKKSIDANDMLELPMSELTLEQLKNLKVYHAVEGRSREAKFFDEHLDEHQPFPTLADALDIIDKHVGFNIEIKSSQQLKDGSVELDRTIDKNKYIDCILDVVLAKANERRIVFSCFDPDMCTMLRFKQNLYPVMFLTLGVTERYPQYQDPRCNKIETAVCNASAMELLGIVAHTEDLLRDVTQINLATDLGLVIFCWGDDNNSQETIKRLKSLGIHAIIYDKMDVLSTKEVKESIFLVAARDPQNELLQLQHLEYSKQTDRISTTHCIADNIDNNINNLQENDKQQQQQQYNFQNISFCSSTSSSSSSSAEK